MKKVTIDRGVLFIDDRPVFCLAGDYPYYRDHPANWPIRLAEMKRMNLNIVTCYVPWRHHEVEVEGRRIIDFNGRTAPNRDVIGFLRQAAELSLWVILKPGPFIHAETNYGGLPDWISPENNRSIQAMVDDRGVPVRWFSEDREPRQPEVLPAPLDPVYLNLVRNWYTAVDRELLVPFGYPRGPIIGVQICNEGIYSDSWVAPWQFDYSSSALRLYQVWLAETYGEIGEYNRLHRTTLTSFSEVEPPRRGRIPTDAGGLLELLDWGRFQSHLLGQVYRTYRGFLATDLPILVNINPVWENPDRVHPQKYDWWLARVVPENWPEVNYGFTNWIGAVSHRFDSLTRYQILVKRAKGINLEENWAYVGNIHQTDPIGENLFRSPAVCAFQTLMAVALGATGYTIYTAVETQGWTAALDTRVGQSHPGDAPLRADGTLSRKAKVARLLNGFFALEGRDVVGAESTAKIAYGISPTAAALSAWIGTCADWPGDDLPIPRVGCLGLESFHNFLFANNLDYRLVNLEAPHPDWEGLAVIAMRNPVLLSAHAQNELVSFCARGGILVMDRGFPLRNERFEDCTLLRERAHAAPARRKSTVIIRQLGAGLVIEYPKGGAFRGRGFLPFLPPDSAPLKLPQGFKVWRRINREAGKEYIFLFNFAGKSVDAAFTVGGHRIRASLPAKGCAALALTAGKLSTGFIIGVHEHERSAVRPRIDVDGQVLAMAEACDLLFRRVEDGYVLWTLGGDEEIRELHRPDPPSRESFSAHNLRKSYNLSDIYLS